MGDFGNSFSVLSNLIKNNLFYQESYPYTTNSDIASYPSYPNGEYMTGYPTPAAPGYYPDAPEGVYYTPEQQLAAQQYYQHQAAAGQEHYYNQARLHHEGK